MMRVWLVLLLSSLLALRGAGGRVDHPEALREPRSAEEGRGLAAVAVPARCAPARSAAASVACALRAASAVLRPGRARAPADGGRALAVFPEAVAWKDALLAPEADRRAALRAFAVPRASLAVGARLCREWPSPPRGAGAAFLEGMACLARERGMEIVFDTLTEERCPPSSSSRCGPDGVLLFNTAVALTASGAVAAVYRKAHIFSTAPFLDEPSAPDAAAFFSEALGCAVGLMVCYDLDFRRPARELLGAGVDVFAMPFDWPSVPPLFSPTMLQQAWSRAHGA